MAENWIEIAQKMAEAARAGLIIERRRIEEIRAGRKSQSSQVPVSSR